ncbi:MAG: enoyl-CoA hydratase/isomerase family protein [Smithellaceae bacterium]
MQYKNILFEKRDGKGILTLNRPDELNALSPEMLKEMLAALRDAVADPQVRVIILKGSGKSFCAGINLKMADGMREDDSKEDASSFEVTLKPVLMLIEDSPKPVICAVQGYAITGGFLLTYTCDFIVASEDAIFQDTHAKWGFVPGGWESLKIPRLIGIPRAKKIFLTCDRLTAQEADKMGLVYSVVPKDKLDQEAEALADKIAKLSGESLKYLKIQINKFSKVDWANAVTMDDALRKDLLGGFMTSETAERLATFTKK